MPAEDVSEAIDLSQLRVTKLRGNRSGSAKIFDLSKDKHIGEIRWKTPRIRAISTTTVCIGHEFAGSTGTQDFFEIRLGDEPAFEHDVKLTTRRIRVTPLNRSLVKSFLAKVGKERGASAVLEFIDGTSIEFQLEPIEYSFKDLIRSYRPFGGHPNALEQLDRVCQEQLELDVNNALIVLSIWAHVRFCLLPQVFLRKDLPS